MGSLTIRINTEVRENEFGAVGLLMIQAVLALVARLHLWTNSDSLTEFDTCHFGANTSDIAHNFMA